MKMSILKGLTIGILCTGMLILGGCSGDNQAPTPPANTVEAPAPAPAPESTSGEVTVKGITATLPEGYYADPEIIYDNMTIYKADKATVEAASDKRSLERIMVQPVVDKSSAPYYLIKEKFPIKDVNAAAKKFNANYKSIGASKFGKTKIAGNDFHYTYSAVDGMVSKVLFGKIGDQLYQITITGEDYRDSKDAISIIETLKCDPVEYAK